MSGLDDDEDHVVHEKEIPKYRIEYTDIKEQELVAKIIKYAAESLENSASDKESSTKLKKLLDTDLELNKPSNPQGTQNSEENGVWQVIIGRQFTASVTFDAEYIVYFNFVDKNKYFMIFRS